ncbi:MAG: alkaline phosphatase family protein [Thermomicrobium sp.]|nr:alkaline phosphatase family protein [Thermomicrobium sp.]
MVHTVERVLLLVLDGLRPDLVTPDTMPFLTALHARGTRLARYCATYPPQTRVQVTTMCTGTHPGRHGILANVLVLEGAGEDGILDTSDYRQLAALDARTDGRAVLQSPLADLLAARGLRLAVAATGSSGSTWLWARTQPYRVVNPRSTFGIPDLASLRAKLGEPPSPEDDSLALVRYAIAAARDLFLPDPDVAVTVLWLHEPDATFHFAGLGSPTSIALLRRLDEQLERLFDQLATRGYLDGLLVFVLSDHGQSTPVLHRSLRELLRNAPPSAALRTLIPAADFLFRLPGTRLPRASELHTLVDWLLVQDWVGAVLVHPELAADLPGTLDLRLVWGGELEDCVLERLPVLAISPRWSTSANADGVPGLVAALTEQTALRSTHGAGSPFDLRAFALVLGPGVPAGVTSSVPAGTTDIAPTIAAVLGLDAVTRFSGRVLHELFDPRWRSPITGELHRAGHDRYLRGWRVGEAFYLEELSGEAMAEQERAVTA